MNNNNTHVLCYFMYYILTFNYNYEQALVPIHSEKLLYFGIEGIYYFELYSNQTHVIEKSMKNINELKNVDYLIVKLDLYFRK